VSKILKIILIFIFITNCSFNKNSKFWTKQEIKPEIETASKEVFKKKETLKLELNPSLKISLYSKSLNNSFLNNYDNNNGRINYNGSLKNLSKFKFSKIKKFDQYDPEISFNKNNIIFFDNKGSILKFDNNSKLIWKKNNYTKAEKKQQPILFFANNNKVLIVADNLGKYYALNVNSGNLLWSKNNVSPFNSQIKIIKNKFFVIDFKNILRAYSILDGKEIWNVQTDNSLIRSQQKLSLIIISKKIYFNNSKGDISAVDIESGELIWQRPTQSSFISDNMFFLKNSEIIGDKDALYFSNNKNQFFSIDRNNGALNWEQRINSTLRSTIIDNYIFTVSKEGYLIIIDKLSGDIIRNTDIFKNIKNKKRANIEPTGFIVGSKSIYLTTNNGRLLIIDITTGRTQNTIKIDNNKILRPSVSKENLYIIKDNSIIKLN
jgi:outer membrane protein assembly factor BamB